MSSSKAKVSRHQNETAAGGASPSVEPESRGGFAVFLLGILALVLLVVAVLVFRGAAGRVDDAQPQPTSRTDQLLAAIESSKSQHDHNQVLAHCRELAKLSPDDVRPWLEIAEIYESRGYQLQLNHVYPEIIKRAPKLAGEYRRRMMHTLIEAGETESAGATFEKLKQGSPEVLRDDPVLEPKLLHLQGKVDEAEARLGEILARHPDNVEAAVLLGRIHLSKERPQQAVRLLEPYVAEQATNARLQYLLGSAHSALGNEDAAYEFLARHRDLKVAHLTIVKIHSHLKNNPVNAALAGQLVWSYATIGDIQQARYWQQVADKLNSAARQDQDARLP